MEDKIESLTASLCEIKVITMVLFLSGVTYQVLNHEYSSESALNYMLYLISLMFLIGIPFMRYYLVLVSALLTIMQFAATVYFHIFGDNNMDAGVFIYIYSPVLIAWLLYAAFRIKSLRSEMTAAGLKLHLGWHEIKIVPVAAQVESSSVATSTSIVVMGTLESTQDRAQ
ncbi:hypothetical protein HDE_07748 [Halotydeus destructor]|nr:hypothetical protein HDE_07748 [Halotydeus destructor]